MRIGYTITWFHFDLTSRFAGGNKPHPRYSTTLRMRKALWANKPYVTWNVLGRKGSPTADSDVQVFSDEVCQKWFRSFRFGRDAAFAAAAAAAAADDDDDDDDDDDSREWSPLFFLFFLEHWIV